MSTVRSSHPPDPDLLIREALDHFSDPNSPIDLRDWIKAARAYLRRVERSSKRRTS